VGLRRTGLPHRQFALQSVPAALAGLANRASQAERKRVPSRRVECEKFQMGDTLQRETHNAFASLRVPIKAILTASLETRREVFSCPQIVFRVQAAKSQARPGSLATIWRRQTTKLVKQRECAASFTSGVPRNKERRCGR